MFFLSTDEETINHGWQHNISKLGFNLFYSIMLFMQKLKRIAKRKTLRLNFNLNASATQFMFMSCQKFLFLTPNTTSVIQLMDFRNPGTYLQSLPSMS